jgi:hypothetical protein
MRIGNKDVRPPFEFWVPDYSDFTLPLKADGKPFKDPEDYEGYLNWLVVHIEKNRYPPNHHHAEILSDPVFQSRDVSGLGLWLGAASISLYYTFVDPMFDYPDDFLADPRPERVCDPRKVKWDDRFYDEDGETVEGMVDLHTYLIFDCMCWQAEKIFEHKRSLLPRTAFIFSDLGWRPLLKVAISRTNNRWEKRETLRRFHEEYAYLSMK